MPCYLLDSLLKGIKGTCNEEGTPADTRAQAGCCLLQTPSSGTRILPCWVPGGWPLQTAPARQQEESQGFPEAPSLPKPLCGALSGSGLTKCCTSSSIRHQNPTPCSFSPFVPDTGVSVTAAFIRGCALDPRWFTCYGFWSLCLMSPLCSCSLSHVFVSSPNVFEDKWPRA